MSNLDHIRSYYEALNTGDVDAIAAHFTDDAVHYYTRLAAWGRKIAENALAIDNIEGHGAEHGSSRLEAVIEWTMTWRDLKSGEARINRGTRVSAPRQQDRRGPRLSPRRPPQPDRRPARLRLLRARLHDSGRPLSVIKDTGERALPPFTDEHEQLRETINRWSRRDRSQPRRVGGGERVSARAFDRAAKLGFLGLKYPVELGGQGGDYVHDAVWAEELAAAGAGGGVAAGPGAHTGIATRRSTASGRRAARALPPPGHPWREGRRARHHRARRRLRRRRHQHIRAAR